MFTPSDAKQRLRKIWDAPIISAVSEFIVKGRLNYFGLPGPMVEDIRDWKQYVGPIFALERNRQDVASLCSNAAALGLLQFGFHCECGELDDFVIRCASDGQSTLKKNWFHLLNLDYCGGWIYKDAAGNAKRVAAFDALVQVQRDTFFAQIGASRPQKSYGLLLMTLNVRSDDKGEINRYVRRQIADEIPDVNLRKAVMGLPEKGHEHWLLRYYVMHNVVEKMSSKGFRVYAFPPLWYRSGKSGLVHFTFVFGLDRSVVGAGQAVQTTGTLLRLPMVTLDQRNTGTCARLDEPLSLTKLLAPYHGLLPHIEEVVSLQRRGAV